MAFINSQPAKNSDIPATLFRKYKFKPVGRPITSGREGPTESISTFRDTVLQPVAQKKKSFTKDSTDLIS